MIRILIVEDEEPISDLIRMNLVKAGYHCKCAFDGNTAADILSQESFDLVLLDIMLPGINGWELLDYIKTLEMPVIFITAMGELDDRVKGLKSGADVEIDIPSRVVMKNGKQIMLTLKEFELLLLFVRNKNIALYRKHLMKSSLKLWRKRSYCLFLVDTVTYQIYGAIVNSEQAVKYMQKMLEQGEEENYNLLEDGFWMNSLLFGQKANYEIQCNSYMAYTDNNK